MGSLLQQKFGGKGSLWTSYLNIENPDCVFELHEEYIDAGADIITTNTFRTNPAAMDDSEDSPKYVAAAFDAAKKARGNSNTILAGCNPPAEDCYQVQRTLTLNELEINHFQHIDLLVQYGSDFVLNETFSHFDEIKIVCEYCSNNNIPFVISLYFTENLHILSGERLQDVLIYINNNFNPLAIGFNCIKPETFLRFFYDESFDYNWGVYFNCGSGKPADTKISCGISPEEYANTVKKLLTKNPSFVGACCGSNPAHIKQIKKALNE